MANGEVYHIFSRSIANFVIFNDRMEFARMQQLMKYYQIKNDFKFSDFMELGITEKMGFNNAFDVISSDKEKLVQIIAYCLMPTHIHLVLKQLCENGISEYMRKMLNSYSSYFNTKHKRKGPLWESKFKNVLVRGDDQLLHLTRYTHLNPVTAKLINHPEDWLYSSHKEYLSEIKDNSGICQFDDILDIQPLLYQKFVNDQISYQRELAKIKNLILD